MEWFPQYENYAKRIKNNIEETTWSPSDWVEDTVIGSNPVTAQMKGPVHWKENIVVIDYWLMVHSGVLKNQTFGNIIRHSILTCMLTLESRCLLVMG